MNIFEYILIIKNNLNMKQRIQINRILVIKQSRRSYRKRDCLPTEQSNQLKQLKKQKIIHKTSNSSSPNCCLSLAIPHKQTFCIVYSSSSLSKLFKVVLNLLVYLFLFYLICELEHSLIFVLQITCYLSLLINHFNPV